MFLANFRPTAGAPLHYVFLGFFPFFPLFSTRKRRTLLFMKKSSQFMEGVVKFGRTFTDEYLFLSGKSQLNFYHFGAMPRESGHDHQNFKIVTKLVLN